MAYRAAERVEVYAAAVRGLATLEPDRERQLKYADFVYIYSALDENEPQRYQREYPNERDTVSSYFQQARQEPQEGRQEGEALVLSRLLQLKFGEIPDDAKRRIAQADPDTLLAWSDRILTAQSVDEVIH